MKNAVANISKVPYYDANWKTRVKCDASHNDLEATLEQQTEDGSWAPISFASRYLNVQEKNIPKVNLSYLQLFGQLTDTNITYSVKSLTLQRIIKPKHQHWMGTKQTKRINSG